LNAIAEGKKETATHAKQKRRLSPFLYDLSPYMDMYREWKNRIPRRLLYMKLETTRLRHRPRNRWQNEVREDGRIVGVEGWQEKIYNREEWKKLLRMVRNQCILLMPMERMNYLPTLKKGVSGVQS
jgi:hypothetical protein